MSDWMHDDDEFADLDLDDDPTPEMLDDGDDVDEFPFRLISNTAPVTPEAIARARAVVLTSDEAVLHAASICETVMATYGDLNEQLNRYMEDILSTLRVMHYEFLRFPGRMFSRAVQAQDDPVKKLAIARQAAKDVADLIELLEDEAKPTPRNTDI